MSNIPLQVLKFLSAFILVPLCSFSQTKNDSVSTVGLLHNKAIYHMHHNELDLALETLNTASRTAENENNVKGLLETYLKFSLVYLELGDLEAATFNKDRGSLFLRDMEHPFGEAFLSFIEARLLLKDQKPFQALQFIEKAKALTNHKNLRNNIQLTEADIFTYLEKFENAVVIYNALLINSDDLEKDYLITKANLGLAELQKKSDDLAKAAEYGEAALHIAEQNQFNRLINKSQAFLTITYEELGQFEKALIYQRKLNIIKDSLFTLEKHLTTSKTADKVKNEQKNAEIQQLRIKNQELLESENRAEFTAILSLAFLVIISLLAISLLRNNQIKVRTNGLLQNKNAELEKARDDAISAMNAKSNFLSTVTHELRTPLYAVTGLTHILLEENPGEHQKENLKSLKFSGDYLLNFINDILQINKIDADKVEVVQTPFKLKKVLTDVIDSLQQNANEQNTILLLNFDNKIPPNILGDPIKLTQIFMNLVGNALKFTEGGQVEVIAKLLGRVEDNVRIHFRVKDTGIGISKEQQKNIFDSFEQGSIQINREYGGTGLGLAIVKSLLGLFNSKISLKSELDVGSTFFFDLEFKCEDQTTIDAPFEIDIDENDFIDLHVLVVEDNKINQVITKKMLAKKEITCDIANNGFEAVEKARTNRYDCILMDIHMPGMGGTEATMKVREFNTEIPIIALTAISMEDSVEEFINAGCNDVVTKPFKPDIFYRKIGENVFRQKLQSGG